MAQKIGYQDGIEAWSEWFTRMGVWQTDFEKWTKLSAGERTTKPPPVPPKIAARGANYNPDDLSTWPWPDKLERTLRILKDEHDAAITPEPPKPPDPPKPPAQNYTKVAPRVAYAEGGSDARFCIVNQPGVIRSGNEWRDESGATYDENGLCKNGRRSGGPALTGARSIDGREYCSLPTMGDPTKNTGSWAI